MKHICKNCRLYNGPNSTCSVLVLHEGQTYKDIPVDPDDKCLWEDLGMADQIKQVRFRAVDKVTGEPTKGEGRILIEYPEDFFGEKS